MSKYVIVTNGDDPLTAPPMAYLAAMYGIPPEDIKALVLTSEAGEVQTLAVTLMVRSGEWPEVL